MRKVLIAEDDRLVGELIRQALIEHGYDVCGIARTVAEGVALGCLHKPDFAILDMQLADGGLGTDIASQLDHHVGILYATGHLSEVWRNVADGDACISKPYRIDDLIRSLQIVANIVATRTASPPFPRDFQLLDGTVRIAV